jgi:hypothetical protein
MEWPGKPKRFGLFWRVTVKTLKYTHPLSALLSENTVSISPLLVVANAPNRVEYMTSDHRVAGSSPAGCKTGLQADRQTITTPETVTNIFT